MTALEVFILDEYYKIQDYSSESLRQRLYGIKCTNNDMY